MPFDENRKGHGGGDPSHDRINEWSWNMAGFIKQQAEKEGLCDECAQMTLANMIVAKVMVPLLDDPAQLAELLQDFCQSALDGAEAVADMEEKPTDEH